MIRQLWYLFKYRNELVNPIDLPLVQILEDKLFTANTAIERLTLEKARSTANADHWFHVARSKLKTLASY